MIQFHVRYIFWGIEISIELTYFIYYIVSLYKGRSYIANFYIFWLMFIFKMIFFIPCHSIWPFTLFVLLLIWFHIMCLIHYLILFFWYHIHIQMSFNHLGNTKFKDDISKHIISKLQWAYSKVLSHNALHFLWALY